jgi:hypothetical protein
MAEHSVLIQPSVTTSSLVEQFGRTVVEALCGGIPVLTSSGEMPNLMGGEPRWTFDQGSIPAVHRALSGLIDQPHEVLGAWVGNSLHNRPWGIGHQSAAGRGAPPLRQRQFALSSGARLPHRPPKWQYGPTLLAALSQERRRLAHQVDPTHTAPKIVDFWCRAAKYEPNARRP